MLVEYARLGGVLGGWHSDVAEWDAGVALCDSVGVATVLHVNRHCHCDYVLSLC